MAKKAKPKAGGLGSLASQLKTVSPKSSNKSEWLDELILAGLKQACFPEGTTTIRSQSDFDEALSKGGKHWVSSTMELETSLVAALTLRDTILAEINQTKINSLKLDAALEDIKAQLYRLFEPRFLRYTSHSALKQYPRYLRAVQSRLEKLHFASKTAKEESALAELQTMFDNKVRELTHADLASDYVFTHTPQLVEFARMLEEWRVSIFAQHLRTQIPVSEKRLRKFWQHEVLS